MEVSVLTVRSFTTSKRGGNPAGVVLRPPQDITEQQMKEVSKQLQVSETAYIFPSTKADMKTRFFSPTSEVDLCGHATIAAFYSIAMNQPHLSDRTLSYIQETNAGLLPVTITVDADEHIEKVMMKHASIQLKDVEVSYQKIAEALRISKTAIDTDLAQQKVSTGLFTLPICVSSFEILKNISPDFDQVKAICDQLDIGSFHVFTFDTLEKDSFYHARNFAPCYGINEDPVTGTANGAVCGYLKAHGILENDEVIVEQGDIIDHSGRVIVQIKKKAVFVGGQAVIVEDKDINV